MKLSFKRGGDIKENLHVGRKWKIKDWLKKHANLDEKSYEFNKDLSIIIYGDLKLLHLGLKKLPDFIDIDVIHGDFWGAGNDWESLEGFPNEVYGDLQVDSISIPSKCIKFSEKYIKKLIKVHGKIWN